MLTALVFPPWSESVEAISSDIEPDVVKAFDKITLLDIPFQPVLLKTGFQCKSWKCKLKLEKKETNESESTNILFLGGRNDAKPATPLHGISCLNEEESPNTGLPEMYDPQTAKNKESIQRESLPSLISMPKPQSKIFNIM